jgi:beta-lactamase superfamily II metal-dependent hydrolase
MSLEIEALGAAHGDALVVRWPDPAGRIRTGLVDGGPAAGFAGQLAPNLASLAHDQGAAAVTLEFVCVSHIDDDHIGGIERLFTTLRRQRRNDLPLTADVERLWFNSWQQLGASETTATAAEAEPLVGASVRQGRDLRDIARLLGLAGNQPVGGALTAGATFDLDGLSVTVVAPGPAQLDRLNTVWERAEKDLPAFTAAYTDRSIPNLSSIALLVGAGGRTALLTGDARGDHVLAGLAAGGLLAGGALHVDVLKLPHHGSINNVAPGFFDAITADRYIVSADGVTHGLPNTETLDMLLASRSATDEFEVLLTNPMPAIESYLATAATGRPIRIVPREAAARGVVA